VPEEGHKYVALMQWAQGCDRPVVLRHEEEAGHSTRSVRQMVDLLVDWLSFCAFHTGLLLPG
jgi:prolyl oligopeptidase